MEELDYNSQSDVATDGSSGENGSWLDSAVKLGQLAVNAYQVYQQGQNGGTPTAQPVTAPAVASPVTSPEPVQPGLVQRMATKFGVAVGMVYGVAALAVLAVAFIGYKLLKRR